MNLSKIQVAMEADGFHIIDNQKEIEEGASLGVQYETAEGWVAKEVRFERDGPTLFHPFRRSMFVYTGGEPRRVLIEGCEPSQRGTARPWDSSDSGDFYCYPEAGSSSWSDNPPPASFPADQSEPSVIETIQLEDERLPESGGEPSPDTMEAPEPNAY